MSDRVSSFLFFQRTQHRHPVFSPSSTPAAPQYLSPSQHRPAVSPQPGMPPLPPGPQYPTASSYGGYAPTPLPMAPGMPPVPGYPPAPAQSMYSQSPLVPGFNQTPAPLAPPPIAPAPIAPTPPVPPSAMPSTYSNYTTYSQPNVPAPSSTMTPVQSYRPQMQVSRCADKSYNYSLNWI